MQRGEQGCRCWWVYESIMENWGASSDSLCYICEADAESSSEKGEDSAFEKNKEYLKNHLQCNYTVYN